MYPAAADHRSDVDPSEADALDEIARRVREHVVRLAGTPNGCHLGGALSCIEVLVTLYFSVLRLDPADPRWADRDIFVFSKGHAAAALYSVLVERGYLPAESLGTYCAAGSALLGHPTRSLPGVEFATGSVGHGLSLGVGTALGLKRWGNRDRRVFVLLGDGEQQEGAVWEAVMAAHHYGLDNLCAVVDRNLGQNDGRTEDIIRLGDVASLWRAFGWAERTVDGHDTGELRAALDAMPYAAGTPSVLVARTVKGRGVPGIEGDPRSHYMTLSPRNVERALRSLRRPGTDKPQ
jgi:transketolase